MPILISSFWYLSHAYVRCEHEGTCGELPVASLQDFCISYFKIKVLERICQALAEVNSLLLCPASDNLQVLESVKVSSVFRPGLNQQKPCGAEGRFRHILRNFFFVWGIIIGFSGDCSMSKKCEHLILLVIVTEYVHTHIHTCKPRTTVQWASCIPHGVPTPQPPPSRLSHVLQPQWPHWALYWVPPNSFLLDSDEVVVYWAVFAHKEICLFFFFSSNPETNLVIWVKLFPF